MPKKTVKIVSKRSAIAGLIANLFLPGLGTIISGKYDVGTIQIILSLAGVFFFFSITSIGVVIGLSLFVSIWIWALIMGIQNLKSKK